MARSSVQHRKLSRLLRRAPEDVVLPIREKIADAAQVLVISARKKVPKDTRNLEENITGKLSRSGLSAQVGVIGKRDQKDAYYAHFVHEGTLGSPERNIPPMERNPFLTDALEENKAEIIRDIDGAVDAALRKLSNG
jgi:HK97 gp10 family phage protein